VTMTTVAQSLPEPSHPLGWLRAFLKEELRPYPGRAATVARMVIAATLVMLTCMMFRIPYAFFGAIYVLLISRESLRATLRVAGSTLAVTGIGAMFLLVSAWFVIGVPALHFFWVIGSLFLAFYVLSTATNYGTAALFVIMIAVGVPLWDRHVSAETNVEDTLRVGLAVSVGALVTAAVEWAFARLRPGDDIVRPIAERLAAVESVLHGYSEDRPSEDAIRSIVGLGMRGTSSLRRALRRADYSPQYRAQMSGVVALVGRLADIAANLTQFSFTPTGSDQNQLRGLATAVATIRTDLTSRRMPASPQLDPDDDSACGVPLLHEMKSIVALIPHAFAESRSMEAYLLTADEEQRTRLIAPDALVNPGHIKFALKGCLAASLCYIIYNAVDWPGISTAVPTCLLTALSTVGASRQKQILRFAGALVGGAIGMGSQIVILPYLESIAGFTVLFVVVTALASWFMTSTPRLSYFGLQMAFGFYLISLQQFALPTSLAGPRDHVAGIVLGLVVMWLVFDQLWGAPAAVEMKRSFVDNLRLLAQLAREPRSQSLEIAIERISSLREMIGNSFDHVRALADAVVLEFGRSRQRDLALRRRIVRAQPRLRMLFITRLATGKYRMQYPGFELPKPVASGQREFDEHLAAALDTIADRMEGRSPEEDPSLGSWVARLERTVEASGPGESHEPPAARFQAFLSLHRRLEDLMMSLNKEI
jgi:multidrug resistance protein MdtO